MSYSYAPGTLVTVIITKDDLTQSVGIGMGYKAQLGYTVITSIKEGALAEKSEQLRVGMMIKSVNNIDCANKNPAEVASLLASSSGTFPILAQVPEASIPNSTQRAATITSTATKKTPTATTNGSRTKARPPPPGLPEGGVWTRKNYAGNQTTIACVVSCFLIGIFAPLVFLCPCDEREVYVVDGKMYAADGSFIGATSKPTSTGKSKRCGVNPNTAADRGRVR